jgi:heme oxygenase
MIALALLYIVALGTLGAVIYHECAKADKREAEVERRWLAALAEEARARQWRMKRRT